MPVAGIDVGAVSAKALILSNDHTFCFSIEPTGHDVSKAAERVATQALEKAGCTKADLDYVMATGYGRYAIPFANETKTEIICHAKGAYFLIPQARTIIDIGGQDSKVIAIDRKGKVTHFVMNDKCAAGTGRFLEVMASALDLELEELGHVSLTSQNPSHISSTCTVFAESEVVSLRAKGETRENLIAGLHKSTVSRVVLMGLGASINFTEEVVFTGGVAKNIGVRKALEEKLCMQILISEEPQIVGALGAALLAAEASVKDM